MIPNKRRNASTDYYYYFFKSNSLLRVFFSFSKQYFFHFRLKISCYFFSFSSRTTCRMTADVGGVVVLETWKKKGICACAPTAFAGTDDFSAANEIVFSRALILYHPALDVIPSLSHPTYTRTLVQVLKNQQKMRKLTRPRNFQSTGKPKRK